MPKLYLQFFSCEDFQRLIKSIGRGYGLNDGLFIQIRIFCVNIVIHLVQYQEGDSEKIMLVNICFSVTFGLSMHYRVNVFAIF